MGSRGPGRQTLALQICALAMRVCSLGEVSWSSMLRVFIFLYVCYTSIKIFLTSIRYISFMTSEFDAFLRTSFHTIML